MIHVECAIKWEYLHGIEMNAILPDSLNLSKCTALTIPNKSFGERTSITAVYIIPITITNTHLRT